MIDTIILRIHNLQKNSYVIDCLNAFEKNSYQTSMVKASRNLLSEIREKGITEGNDIVEILKHKQSDDYLIKTVVSKQVNKSNHYNVTYFVNYIKDYIELNFSVPKFLFGTNILMFVEHYNDRQYRVYENSLFDYNCSITYDRLINFLEIFFKRQIIQEIDFLDVEVNRIDVSYNQVFETKEDALLYLEYQKKLKKKHSRNEEGVMTDYATSLMYKTKRYSAKIYHKGTEYSKHDLKEHLRINNTKGFEYFNTKQLQSFSDRILRYELTLRNAFLNYVHKKNIFRKNCKIFQNDLALYNSFELKKQRNERISKTAGLLSEAERKKYLKLNPYYKFTTDEKNAKKHVTKLINSRTFFMLETDEETKQYNTKTVDYLLHYAKFSKGLTNLCFDKLKEFISEFQIKELPEEQKIIQLIDSYNSIHKTKLPKGEMLIFYNQMQQFGSFKNVQKMCLYSRATIYRYKERFKKVGISENCLLPTDESYTLPLVTTELKEYHNCIFYEYLDILRTVNKSYYL